MDKKELIAMAVGALGAVVAAARQDYATWQKSGNNFDWDLALKRWAIAAVLGAATTAGATHVS